MLSLTNALKEKAQIAQLRAMIAIKEAKENIKNYASEVESGDHLLEVLGTIIIAIVILVMFREKIIAVFDNALGKTTNQMDNLFNDAGATP